MLIPASEKFSWRLKLQPEEASETNHRQQYDFLEELEFRPWVQTGHSQIIYYLFELKHPKCIQAYPADY